MVRAIQLEQYSGFWTNFLSEIGEGKRGERERERKMIFNFENCLFAELKYKINLTKM